MMMTAMVSRWRVILFRFLVASSHFCLVYLITSCCHQCGY
jgi:ABC-type transport system involved in multi-copper enzyme maturation permease subunit